MMVANDMTLDLALYLKTIWFAGSDSRQVLLDVGFTNRQISQCESRATRLGYVSEWALTKSGELLDEQTKY